MMGAWGSGPFENDSVLDWLCNIEDEFFDENKSPDSTFDHVFKPDILKPDAITGRTNTQEGIINYLKSTLISTAGYLENDEASAALGAVAIVAASISRVSFYLPNSALNIAENCDLTSLVPLALSALDVLGSAKLNEIHQLWIDTESGNEYVKILIELKAILDNETL